MNKAEREWVAMMLAELKFIGLGSISDHYCDVLGRMDPLVSTEYRACVKTFRLVEREAPSESKGNHSRDGQDVP